MAASLGWPAASEAQWKLEKSEALPATGAGIAHICQTLRDSAPAPGSADQAVVHFIVFNCRKNTLRVFDQGSTGRASLGQAMEEHHCLAGTNGGYFQPDFEPVGLLVSDGRVVRRAQRAPLLSGALIVTGNHIDLRRSSDPLPGKHTRQAVQSGPFLVEGGLTVSGLNNLRSARRTAVATDGSDQWALISASSVTLAQLGAILADSALAPTGFKIRNALNLDGGSSTGLWARQPEAAPFYLSEYGIVRDFIGIVPR